MAEASAALDRADSKIESLSGRLKDSVAVQVAFADMTLGRLRAAAQAAAKIEDQGIENATLSQIAFLEGDEPGLRRHLSFRGQTDWQDLWRSVPWAPTFVLQLRTGMRDEPERFMKENANGTASLDAPIMRGAIALSVGRRSVAFREIQQGWERYRNSAWIPPMFYLSSESLAQLLVERGDISGAIQTLEFPKRYHQAIDLATAAYWLRNRLQLSTLYRRAGRLQDANKVEEELRVLLAVADPDHPIRKALERLPS
jgi:hypothetical protein